MFDEKRLEALCDCNKCKKFPCVFCGELAEQDYKAESGETKYNDEFDYISLCKKEKRIEYLKLILC